jgi:tetratricopeptide (TPR) repeat protein
MDLSVTYVVLSVADERCVTHTLPRSSQHRSCPLARFVCLVMLLAVLRVQSPAQTAEDWHQLVRGEVKDHHLKEALTVIDERLTLAPEDLEAHGWRGRLLAWTNRWPEGEAEYRLVLEKSPDDTEILVALADVLLWQKKYDESLQVLDHARALAPRDPEILIRRARVLALLNRTVEASAQYRETLDLNPEDSDAKAALLSLASDTRHELRVENDTDFFSYTNSAETQRISLSSRWNQRWSTVFSTNIYQRFGEDAGNFVASAAYHFTHQDSLSAGGAVANQQTVAPTKEAFFEYGHGFKFDNRWVPGLESSYQQHWFWYRGAQVFTVSTTNIIYLPQGWTYTLAVIGSRTVFTGHLPDWVPSGWTKLGFPLQRRLTGNIFYAVGSENFSQVDQIGRLATHTYGGGLRYQFAEHQDITGYVSQQDRSHDQTETSFGLGYGIRF